jgi:hypothetical protein
MVSLLVLTLPRVVPFGFSCESVTTDYAYNLAGLHLAYVTSLVRRDGLRHIIVITDLETNTSPIDTSVAIRCKCPGLQLLGHFSTLLSGYLLGKQGRDASNLERQYLHRHWCQDISDRYLSGELSQNPVPEIDRNQGIN